MITACKLKLGLNLFENVELIRGLETQYNDRVGYRQKELFSNEKVASLFKNFLVNLEGDNYNLARNVFDDRLKSRDAFKEKVNLDLAKMNIIYGFKNIDDIICAINEGDFSDNELIALILATGHMNFDWLALEKSQDLLNAISKRYYNTQSLLLRSLMFIIPNSEAFINIASFESFLNDVLCIDSLEVKTKLLINSLNVLAKKTAFNTTSIDMDKIFSIFLSKDVLLDIQKDVNFKDYAKLLACDKFKNLLETTLKQEENIETLHLFQCNEPTVKFLNSISKKVNKTIFARYVLGHITNNIEDLSFTEIKKLAICVIKADASREIIERAIRLVKLKLEYKYTQTKIRTEKETVFLNSILPFVETCDRIHIIGQISTLELIGFDFLEEFLECFINNSEYLLKANENFKDYYSKNSIFYNKMIKCYMINANEKLSTERKNKFVEIITKFVEKVSIKIDSAEAFLNVFKIVRTNINYKELFKKECCYILDTVYNPYEFAEIMTLELDYFIDFEILLTIVLRLIAKPQKTGFYVGDKYFKDMDSSALIKASSFMFENIDMHSKQLNLQNIKDLLSENINLEFITDEDMLSGKNGQSKVCIEKLDYILNGDISHIPKLLVGHTYLNILNVFHNSKIYTNYMTHKIKKTSVQNKNNFKTWIDNSITENILTIQTLENYLLENIEEVKKMDSKDICKNYEQVLQNIHIKTLEELEAHITNIFNMNLLDKNLLGEVILSKLIKKEKSETENSSKLLEKNKDIVTTFQKYSPKNIIELYKSAYNNYEFFCTHKEQIKRLLSNMEISLCFKDIRQLQDLTEIANDKYLMENDLWLTWVYKNLTEFKVTKDNLELLKKVIALNPKVLPKNLKLDNKMSFENFIKLNQFAAFTEEKFEELICTSKDIVFSSDLRTTHCRLLQYLNKGVEISKNVNKQELFQDTQSDNVRYTLEILDYLEPEFLEFIMLTETFIKNSKKILDFIQNNLLLNNSNCWSEINTFIPSIATLDDENMDLVLKAFNKKIPKRTIFTWLKQDNKKTVFKKLLRLYLGELPTIASLENSASIVEYIKVLTSGVDIYVALYAYDTFHTLESYWIDTILDVVKKVDIDLKDFPKITKYKPDVISKTLATFDKKISYELFEGLYALNRKVDISKEDTALVIDIVTKNGDIHTDVFFTALRTILDRELTGTLSVAISIINEENLLDTFRHIIRLHHCPATIKLQQNTNKYNPSLRFLIEPVTEVYFDPNTHKENFKTLLLECNTLFDIELVRKVLSKQPILTLRKLSLKELQVFCAQNSNYTKLFLKNINKHSNLREKITIDSLIETMGLDFVWTNTLDGNTTSAIDYVVEIFEKVQKGLDIYDILNNKSLIVGNTTIKNITNFNNKYNYSEHLVNMIKEEDIIFSLSVDSKNVKIFDITTTNSSQEENVIFAIADLDIYIYPEDSELFDENALQEYNLALENAAKNSKLWVLNFKNTNIELTEDFKQTLRQFFEKEDELYFLV